MSGAAMDYLVVARGEERARARLPQEQAMELAARLRQEGRRVRVVDLSHAWTAIPARSWLLIVAVYMAGVLAAGRVSPFFWPVTALVVSTLLVVADRAMRRPLALPEQPVVSDVFPPSTRRLIDDVLARMSTPAARSLLDDVLRRSSALIVDLSTEARDASNRRDVVAIVEASAELAEELDRLDAFLAMPAASRDAALRESCRIHRERLAGRLADASAAIDTLHGQRLEEESDASARVAELASELSAEARARREAAREIESVLGGARS